MPLSVVPDCSLVHRPGLFRRGADTPQKEYSPTHCELKSLCMPVTQTREIAPAQRLENLRYAIRDLVSLADEVKRQGHKVLYLNVGDPNIFDFAPPAHVIEAAYRAMRDNKNGYAPSAGVPEALDAIRGEAAKNGISTVQDVFITNGAGEAVDLCLTALLNPGDNVLTPRPDYPLYPAVLCKVGAEPNPYYL